MCRAVELAVGAVLTVSFCCLASAGEVVFDLKAPSPVLGREITYTLYRPDSAPAEDSPLPVLYLFHGLDGSARDWVELGRARETLDRLIAEKRLKPLLVVMPMAGNGWYVDNPDPGGMGALAKALTQDLVTHVERTHPALSCRSGRATGGLSMGGYGALLYAMDHPDRYAAAFSLSGALFQPMPERRRPGEPADPHVQERVWPALRLAPLQSLEPVHPAACLCRLS
jgi:S-formylglutathione hydrolase FrmB